MGLELINTKKVSDGDLDHLNPQNLSIYLSACCAVSSACLDFMPACHKPRLPFA